VSAEKMPPNPFTRDETGLQELLLEQAGTIADLSRESDGYRMRASRYEEAIAALQWILSRLPAQHAAVMTPHDVMELTGQASIYAATGRIPDWLASARSQMDR